MNVSAMHRGRHSTMRSTPQSTPRSTAQPTQRSTDAPDHQPPTFPLNPAAQRALAHLARSNNLLKLKKSLGEAQTQLTDAAVQMNDRVTIQSSAVKRSRDKRQREHEGPDDEQAELEQKLAQFQEKVDGMTQRMEESMRKLIDHQQGVEAMTHALEKTEQHARNNASTQASTQHARTQRATRRAAAEGGDDEDEDASGGEEEYPDFTPTDPAGGTPAQRAPVEVFRATVDDSKLRYQSKTQAERYADAQPYTNFRETVHDAVHHDKEEPPPLDKENWFSEGGVPAPGITNRNVDADIEDDDDDLAISKATISTRCPLTLREFVNPYTSKKCPHSFEKEAILDLVNNSARRTTPQNGQRQGEKFVLCPVSGCQEQLTRNDLGVDKVIVRKIQRLQRSKQLQEEEGDDDDGDGNHGNTQRRAFSIDDNAEDDVDEPTVRPKAEPRPTGASNRPSAAPRPTQVIDLSDEEEEEEAEEDSMAD